jgi:hypothetical protein
MRGIYYVKRKKERGKGKTSLYLAAQEGLLISVFDK